MKYFVAKIKYQEPVPGKDTMKKVKKGYLVSAETVSDVETKVQGWWPANWQDPSVEDVVSVSLQEIHTEGESETWWLFKVMYENVETGKWAPVLVATNSGMIDLALQRIKKLHPMGEVEEIKKFKVIIDEDLTK